ncbi:hypothetical protein [Actinomycetospora sp. CA-053990]|uniref:hypothetical protein n=1 Tax=Actinomycetospora sp. CA-053990 TaxID=3239891 RepID=UPI003D901FFB
MDPALIGVIGTGAGAIVGYLGTLTTAHLTRKRERDARIFDEKRKVYVETLSFCSNFASLVDAINESDGGLDDAFHRTRFEDAAKMLSELGMLAPADVALKANETLTAIVASRSAAKTDNYGEARKAADKQVAELARLMRADIDKHK